MPGQVYAGSIADMPKETRLDGGYHRTGLVMDYANLSFVWLEAGAYTGMQDESGLAPGHSHGFDMLIYVISGDLRFWTDDDVHDLHSGDFIYIPRDVPHGGMPIDGSPVHLLEVFAPIRTDYLYIAEHQLADGQADRDSTGARIDNRSLRELAQSMRDSTPARKAAE